MSPCSEAIFDSDRRNERIAELNELRLDPDFWNNQDKARRVEKEISVEQGWITAWEEVKRLAEDVETLLELSSEGETGLENEIQAEAEKLS